jgi:membrane protease YdiL (CAAX protease family)
LAKSTPLFEILTFKRPNEETWMTFAAVKQKIRFQLRRFPLPEVSNWDIAVGVTLLSAWQLLGNVGELISVFSVLLIAAAAVCVSAVSLRPGCYAPALRALGWTVPPPRFFPIGIVSGLLAAFGVTVVVHAAGIKMIRGPLPIEVLALTVGPIVEESFFRGFLQPWLTASAGALTAVFGTAFIFAAVHGPISFLQLFCFTAMGAAYGFLRLRSGSVLISTVMHSTYNFAILLMSWPK